MIGTLSSGRQDCGRRRDADQAAVDAALSKVLPVVAEEAAAVDRDATFPVHGLKELRRSGLLGLLVPTKHGGMGGNLRNMWQVADALAGRCLSTAMIWAMHCQQAATLAGHADPPLARDVLPRVAAGQVYLASVTTERVKGGHLLSAHAPLQRQDGQLHLEREAPIVTGGTHADGFLITMRESAEAPAEAVTLVYADRSELTITTRGFWDPLGMRGTHSVAVTLEGTVSPERVVGEPGKFGELALRTFIPAGHVAWTSCWLGAARQAFADVVALVRDPRNRGQFDPRSDLLRTRLARVRMELDVAAALLGRVIEDIEQVDRGEAQPEAVEVQLRLNALKVHVAERTFAVVDELVQLVGLRHGYLRGSGLGLERVLRDLRSASLNYANERLLLANGALALLSQEVRLD